MTNFHRIAWYAQTGLTFKSSAVERLMDETIEGQQEMLSQSLIKLLYSLAMQVDILCNTTYVTKYTAT